MADQRVSIGRIGSKGRGVVAGVPIAAGTVIEMAPSVELSSEDCDRVEATVLGNYYFAHPGSEERGLVVFGMASLLNHSDRPNTDIDWRHDADRGWLAVLRAACDIGAGEELTRRYRCPLWFDPEA